MQKQLSQSLNARQLKALQAGAPTADDILGNPEFMNELNKEIADTYVSPIINEIPVVKETRGQKPVREERKVMPLPRSGTTQPTLSDLGPEAELEEMNRRSEALIAKKRAAAEAAAEAAEPVPEVAENPEEVLRGQILGALTNHKQAPTEADIAKWKREYGENAIYVSALNEDDVFVFTYLRRLQWQKIQQAIANAQKAEGLNADPENLLKEKVLQFTVLWPRPLTLEFFNSSRAGTVDTLFNVIMANSSFLQLNQAMILTTQL